ncbi:MAG: VC_2705 family sodium/solute symporter, partial [Mangrovicoccus sp.]|nr:VC_2705 family sodium/solute symporter [Mangrovicoccus sp.]
MGPVALNLLAVGASFALYVLISFRTRAGTMSEFYVAGRRVHPITNGMATAADWMSAASFLSMAGLIAWSGYGASSYLMGWTGGYVLLALLLAPYLRKSGALTVAGFIGKRFYSPAARIVAVIALIAVSSTYLVGQMTGLGIAFARLLGIDLTSGLMTGAALVFLCVVPGGMRSVTYTQVAQYVVLVAAYTLPAAFLSLLLTGTPLPPLALFGDLSGSGTPLLERLNAIVTDLGFSAYTGQDGTPAQVIDMVLFTLTLMIGTAGLPHVLMRFLTVPRASDARWSAGWAMLFITLLYLCAPTLGAMLRLNMVETLYPEGPRGAAMVYVDRPDWMKSWEEIGLLNWDDRNGDGRVQSYNGDSAAFRAEAAARGWEGNE